MFKIISRILSSILVYRLDTNGVSVDSINRVWSSLCNLWIIKKSVLKQQSINYYSGMPSWIQFASLSLTSLSLVAPLIRLSPSNQDSVIQRACSLSLMRVCWCRFCLLVRCRCFAWDVCVYASVWMLCGGVGFQPNAVTAIFLSVVWCGVVYSADWYG